MFRFHFLRSLKFRYFPLHTYTSFTPQLSGCSSWSDILLFCLSYRWSQFSWLYPIILLALSIFCPIFACSLLSILATSSKVVSTLMSHNLPEWFVGAEFCSVFDVRALVGLLSVSRRLFYCLSRNSPCFCLFPFSGSLILSQQICILFLVLEIWSLIQLSFRAQEMQQMTNCCSTPGLQIDWLLDRPSPHVHTYQEICIHTLSIQAFKESIIQSGVEIMEICLWWFARVIDLHFPLFLSLFSCSYLAKGFTLSQWPEYSLIDSSAARSTSVYTKAVIILIIKLFCDARLPHLLPRSYSLPHSCDTIRPFTYHTLFRRHLVFPLFDVQFVAFFLSLSLSPLSLSLSLYHSRVCYWFSLWELSFEVFEKLFSIIALGDLSIDLSTSEYVVLKWFAIVWSTQFVCCKKFVCFPLSIDMSLYTVPARKSWSLPTHAPDYCHSTCPTVANFVSRWRLFFTTRKSPFRYRCWIWSVVICVRYLFVSRPTRSSHSIEYLQCGLIEFGTLSVRCRHLSFTVRCLQYRESFEVIKFQALYFETALSRICLCLIVIFIKLFVARLLLIWYRNVECSRLLLSRSEKILKRLLL